MMGDFSYYNDYELLYLVRANIDEAREILIWKYSFLIKATIHKMKVPMKDWDDFYQEGCLVLLLTIRIYDDHHRMSFTNFFNLLLRRKFITLLKREHLNNSYDINEGLDYNVKPKYCDDVYYLLEESHNELSELEQSVYRAFFIEGLKVEMIAKKLDIDAKSVSNAKVRIIKKLKNKLQRRQQKSFY